jgi:hypothetical protein
MGEIQEYGCACLELIHVCSWHEVICWTVLDVSLVHNTTAFVFVLFIGFVKMVLAGCKIPYIERTRDRYGLISPD